MRDLWHVDARPTLESAALSQGKTYDSNARQEAREQREPFFEGDEEVQGNGKQEHPVGMVRVAGLGWAANLRDPHQVPLLSRCRCFAAMGSAAMGARV